MNLMWIHREPEGKKRKVESAGKLPPEWNRHTHKGDTKSEPHNCRKKRKGQGKRGRKAKELIFNSARLKQFVCVNDSVFATIC